MIKPRRNRAVITGMGVLAANGTGLDEFWSTLLAGKSGIGPITLFDASALACKIAGEVKNFDPSVYIDQSMRPKRMGRFTQLGIAAAKMAISDSHLTQEELERCVDLPVVLGVSTNAMDLTQVAPRIHTAVAGVPHAATSAIGYMHDVRTRLITLSTGCASSLDAVGMAARMIGEGESDVAVAGGAEAAIVHYVIESMLKCKRCSQRNDFPEKASRPFDADRDFGIMAEGAGIVILENEEHARARGARIYSRVAGYGTCADPRNSAEGTGMFQSMNLALHASGYSHKDVGCLFAHGPSDIDMDIVETQMIKSAFKEDAYLLPVTSIKGVTGCPMGAGGVLQLIAACCTIKQNLIPPTANYENPDPECDLDYVPRLPRQANIRTALINSHGFGRGNSSMIIESIDM